jgi:hypothetical protein
MTNCNNINFQMWSVLSLIFIPPYTSYVHNIILLHIKLLGKLRDILVVLFPVNFGKQRETFAIYTYIESGFVFAGILRLLSWHEGLCIVRLYQQWQHERYIGIVCGGR